MVSKESSRVVLSNSESDSETGPSPSLEAPCGPDGKQQVKKRNKALQVRFKDICDAQNEQRAGLPGAKSISCKVAYRKYMTMPARRSIPNVTKSTGVQTSPEHKKHYQTFPFERKKGHTIKHAALVEDYRGQNNGFLTDSRGQEEAVLEGSASSQGVGDNVQHTQALLHHTDGGADNLLFSANCVDGREHTDSPLLKKETECFAKETSPRREPEYQEGGARTKHKGLSKADVTGANPSTKRQLANYVETVQDTKSKVTSPVAWNSLTQVEGLGPESPSVQSKRKKVTQANGPQSQTLPHPHSAGCSVAKVKVHQCQSGTLPISKKPQAVLEDQASPRGQQGACQQIVPLPGNGDIKEKLQAMENLISSSQETIKVLLGVIQELEKGEAQREGLSYRTGQDTANCDTCRNSACIIYSVELDFKQQEDKIQHLIRRLCPMDDPQFPALPYPHEVFTSTPKRKSETESKKHGRWKLWFL
ncbi:inhibitory synaptic factor 2A [Esox lucius]|uniref:Inhibitory synaptic factor 2A n=1 Tax=Esox lucius TaxID=8010 RepID=A0A3P8XRB2_ESOLU|nr:inhibitory synaptic factor 2A [Esox lucius]XP_019902676.1 inhibitory synaptic factor 2A [Esox lucius]